MHCPGSNNDYCNKVVYASVKPFFHGWHAFGYEAFPVDDTFVPLCNIRVS